MGTTAAGRTWLHTHITYKGGRGGQPQNKRKGSTAYKEGGGGLMAGVGKLIPFAKHLAFWCFLGSFGTSWNSMGHPGGLRSLWVPPRRLGASWNLLRVPGSSRGPPGNRQPACHPVSQHFWPKAKYEIKNFSKRSVAGGILINQLKIKRKLCKSVFCKCLAKVSECP